jgi:hypothetical protein
MADGGCLDVFRALSREEQHEMKKRLLALALVMMLLAVATGPTLAGGKRNAPFIKFLQLGPFVPGPYYCEGTYMTTANGIVHGWRNNPECVPYQPFINEYSVHMVFKPMSEFAEADCDEEGLIIEISDWTMTGMYIEQPGDDADLRDVFGEDGERTYFVCFYHWDTD